MKYKRKHKVEVRFDYGWLVGKVAKIKQGIKAEIKSASNKNHFSLRGGMKEKKHNTTN